ncbi:hypothetical protein BKA59DRAFT_526690 [Fusarium tricinctum]|uniref:Uncharacterized protein n=1 Tax=Fusarium tricinctum TaxID=61284 RepID=A0A8K0RSZ9_9HYPO|nr:hypothetical protein BKA59DRAFT_526690 [Fusarium tricinctum]
MASPTTTLSNQTEPLLGGKATDITVRKQLSSVTSTTIKTVSILRIIFGGACVIAPQTTCEIFFYSVPAAFSILPRLFGIRDLLLGALLVTAEDKNVPSGGRRELRRTLWANIAADSVDVVSIALSFTSMNIACTINFQEARYLRCTSSAAKQDQGQESQSQTPRRPPDRDSQPIILDRYLGEVDLKNTTYSRISRPPPPWGAETN